MCNISFSDITTKSIQIHKGIGMPDTISPKLFTPARKDALKKLNREDKGVRVDGQNLKKNVRFAVNIVLINDNTNIE